MEPNTGGYMAKDLLYFDGVSVSSDHMIGTITSDQLIEHFGKHWIPYYQRDRVMSSKKIERLIDIYKRHGKIDAIKLHLKGEYTYDKKRGEALLEGDFCVIDGQQRLWSLKDSLITDFKFPVEVYFNLKEDDQINLFHQFNRDPTKLSFGELAKSTQGPFGDSVRLMLKRKNVMPIPLSVNGTKGHMSLSTFCPIMYQTHRKMYRDLRILKPAGGKVLLKFLADPYDGSEVNLTMFATRNVVQSCVDIFGTYDNKATAYRRSFFTAWCQMIVNNFLTTEGKVDFGKFKSKIKEIPDKVVMNAQIREVVKMGGEGAPEMIYNEMVDHLNHKLQRGHLPRTNEIEQSDKAMSHIKGSSLSKARAQIVEAHR